MWLVCKMMNGKWNSGPDDGGGVTWQAWLEEMKESGNMEQLCWNTVFMKSMIMDQNSTDIDPFCW